MIATLIIGIISVFLAYISRFKETKWGLKASVSVIFVFLALRYDFGNDYMGYLNIFELINEPFYFDSSSYQTRGTEIGWVFLNRIFKPFGFFALVAFLALFNCLVLYHFIKKNVSPSYYWFAIFIFIFESHNMLVFSSAMRQAVAVSFFLIAIDYLLQKKIAIYLIFISIAILFHSSAAFLYPLVILPYINKKINFKYLLIIYSMLLFLFVNIESFIGYINLFITNYFDFYLGYVEGSELITNIGLGFAINIMIYLIVISNSLNDENFKNNMFYKFAVISIFLIPLSFGVNLLSRLNFYFSLPIMMVLFPIVFIKIKNKIFKIGFMSIILLFTIYKFFGFFYSDIWNEHFFEYHTIFSMLN